ncbi:MAG TPA: type III-A CRISPR-associated RAMP protein Csm5 [Candidatus Cloacimonadota bacterium]|nr:type III-A CRISPR-associated RAMP protein Csm5 [Candidatus Cloacimonadota bacterium]
MKSRNYKFKIHPITPFHIGNGDVHDPLNLVIKDNMAYFLNQLEYIRFLLAKDARLLQAKLAVSDIKQIQQYFHEAFNPAQKQCYYFSYPVSEAICKDYAKKMQNLQAEGFVHAFIRSQLSKQPYIPGSSIKGAFRTAILSHYQHEKPQVSLRNTDRDDRRIQAEHLNYWNYDRNRDDIPSDPFKFIKFADTPWSNEWMGIFEIGVTEPPAALDRQANPFFRAGASPMRRKEATLPILMEIALSKPGRFIESDLSIAVTDTKNRGIAKIQPKGVDDLSPLLDMVRQYYHAQLEKESTFYSRLDGKAKQNYEVITKAHASLKAHECMIKLGQGSGQNYCSYAAMNYNPKTRKLCYNLPMGWMKLSFDLGG